MCRRRQRETGWLYASRFALAAPTGFGRQMRFPASFAQCLKRLRCRSHVSAKATSSSLSPRACASVAWPLDAAVSWAGIYMFRCADCVRGWTLQLPETPCTRLLTRAEQTRRHVETSREQGKDPGRTGPKWHRESQAETGDAGSFFRMFRKTDTARGQGAEQCVQGEISVAALR